MAELWRVEQGGFVGCPVGTIVALEREGDEIRVVRPSIGLMQRFDARVTEQRGWATPSR